MVVVYTTKGVGGFCHATNSLLNRGAIPGTVGASTGRSNSIAFLGIVGSFVLDAKKARQHEAAWHAFAAATSNVPFLAIIRDRQRLSLREIGPRRIASGFGVLLIMFMFDAFHSSASLFANGWIALR